MSIQTHPAPIQSLVEALRKELNGSVEVEPVPATNRYRLAVVSDAFQDVPQLARQDRVWRIADSVMSREDGLLISMILTFAPSEIESSAG